MPASKPFQTIAGSFAPVGQCTASEGCSNEGWNLLDSLCLEHFHELRLLPQQRDLDRLAGLYDSVRLLGIERKAPRVAGSGEPEQSPYPEPTGSGPALGKPTEAGRSGALRAKKPSNDIEI